jgi:hypothetical protein
MLGPKLARRLFDQQDLTIDVVAHATCPFRYALGFNFRGWSKITGRYCQTVYMHLPNG